MKYLNGNKIGLFRITAADREKLFSLVFKRYPRHEWGSFFRFGYRLTEWGIHISFVDAMEPRPGNLNEKSGIVEFSAGYILRAQLALDETKLGIGMIHSHPQDCGTDASGLDNDMDGYFSAEFAQYCSGRPYVSLRVAKTADGLFYFSGEAWINGEWFPISEWMTLGAQLERDVSQAFVAFRRNGSDLSDETRARLKELVGERSTRLLNSKVGIIGCSGTGSPAVHVLVRAGVRRFVLVDPDVFVASNLERLHGSQWEDIKKQPLKIEILRRLILKINPKAEVTVIRGNVLDENVLDQLLLCDLVLGCTDSQHSRAALGDFASHYLLPCLDVAVLMRAKDGKLTEQVGEIVRYTADEPCPWCLGRIHQKALAYELMTDAEREQRAQAAADAVKRGIDGEQYWGDKPPKELTVGYMTTAIGALQAGYAETWILGAATMPHQRFQFDLGMPLLGVVPAEKPRQPECSCSWTKGWSDQARADRSVTKPPHWP